VYETDPKAALPWYRFFWPWFIVLLLTASVVAGITTVVIAFRNQDSLVDDHYYEAGNAINRRLAAEANAVRLGIRAAVAIDELTGEVHITLAGDLESLPESLVLELSHATRETHDATVTLARTGADRFYGQLEAAPPSGRYYATLRLPPTAGEAVGEAAPEWRLQREIRLPSRDPLPFGAVP